MKKVLIVDDEIAVASIFETALRTGGYEVKIAPTGKQGIQIASGEKFDLIILDQVLGDTTGNEVLTLLKQEEATKNIPVVMLTNFGFEDLTEKALGMGAIEYMLKYQTSPSDLVSKVKLIIGD